MESKNVYVGITCAVASVGIGYYIYKVLKKNNTNVNDDDKSETSEKSESN